MLDSMRVKQVRLNIFSTITFALIILVIIFADSIISNVSLHFDALENGVINHHNQLQSSHEAARILKLTSADDDGGSYLSARPENRLRPEELSAFEVSYLGRRFHTRVEEYFTTNKCKIRIFMTWIASVDSFGKRELLGLESLFHTNPTSCLIILSKAMDSEEGSKVLAPLTKLGFLVKPMAPSLWDLVKNTPAERWFNDVKNGSVKPGGIPLAQNLSNLIRLAVLYKFGGVYLDTDFIILKDLSGLRNTLGAQSVDVNGNWTRLNNAILVFEKSHPLVYKFLEEFASSFDGNKWGHNGPYLVSRVVAKVGDQLNFTVLPPAAFYPVYWTRMAGFFVRPRDRVQAKWVEAKIRQLNGSSYGVHLWNSQSSRFKIEEGSIVERLISDNCVLCRHSSFSSS